MNSTMQTAALAFVFPQPHAGANAGRSRSARERREMAGRLYSVPMVADAGEPCCFAWRRSRPGARGCDLDGHHWNFGTSDERPRATVARSALDVYLHASTRRIDDVRAFGASCPVRSATPPRLDAVDPGESVACWRTAGSRRGRGRRLRPRRARLSCGSLGRRRYLPRAQSPRTRASSAKQALFWLGQTRGADGADIVERYATTDDAPTCARTRCSCCPSRTLDDSYAHIHAIAQRDPSADVRGQALFWMAQMGDPRAGADIASTLPRSARRRYASKACSRYRNSTASEATRR